MFVEIYNTFFSRKSSRSAWSVTPRPSLWEQEAATRSSSYRLNYLLNTSSEVLKGILCNRLANYTERLTGLSDKHRGFRKSFRTIDAMDTFTGVTREDVSGRKWLRDTKKYCAILTLDIRNAFNLVRWSRVLNTLQNVGVPGYLRWIIGSCHQWESRDSQYHERSPTGLGSNSLAMDCHVQRL